jgi:hypothetical protein
MNTGMEKPEIYDGDHIKIEISGLDVNLPRSALS